jgi:hypothetical protein
MFLRCPRGALPGGPSCPPPASRACRPSASRTGRRSAAHPSSRITTDLHGCQLPADGAHRTTSRTLSTTSSVRRGSGRSPAVERRYRVRARDRSSVALSCGGALAQPVPPAVVSYVSIMASQFLDCRATGSSAGGARARSWPSREPDLLEALAAEMLGESGSRPTPPRMC